MLYLLSGLYNYCKVLVQNIKSMRCMQYKGKTDRDLSNKEYYILDGMCATIIIMLNLIKFDSTFSWGTDHSTGKPLKYWVRILLTLFLNNRTIRFRGNYDFYVSYEN